MTIQDSSREKEPLIFDDYKWRKYSSFDPHVHGAVDSTIFDKYDGCQVMYLINYCMKTGKLPGHMKTALEILIRRALPAYARTQERAAAWLISTINR